MKKSSDDLFALIKSLDTREKIFFKVYSANKGSNKHSLSYLKLFDAIDKLVRKDSFGETYNKSLLTTKLKQIGFAHHLKKAKSYLTNAIYNSLREYHSDASVNTQLQKLLHLAEVLIKKKLNDQAKKYY